MRNVAALAGDFAENIVEADEIVFWISRDDLAMAAIDAIGRDLEPHEVDRVERNLGIYLNWCKALQDCIKAEIKGEWK